MRLLDRSTVRWRRLRSSDAVIAGMARLARLAEMAGIFRYQPTTALAAANFGKLCAGAEPVTSAEALVAGHVQASRRWTLETDEPAVNPDRLLALDGCRPPTFSSDPIEPWLKQTFLRMREAVVFPRTGLIMPEPGVVHRINVPRWKADHRLFPGFVDFANDTLLARTNALRPKRHIQRTVLVLCHAFHRNYGHWLFDILPCLLPWIGLLQQHRVAALLPPLHGEWQRRTLELLGVPASALIEAPQSSILCDDAIVPGLTIPDDRQPIGPPHAWAPQPVLAVSEIIDTLRRAVPPAAGIESFARIYVSRRGLVSFREMRNEDELEAALARLGFAIVRPQDLTFDQQVAIFARARVVVGPHGAGLTNAAFAPPGCLVIDILPGVWHTRWLLRLTSMFGHHYLPVAYANDPALSQPLRLGDAVIRHSEIYTVPVDEVAAVVTRAMRKLGIEAGPVPDGAA